MRRARRIFGTPRFRALRRALEPDGQRAVDVASSRGIAEAARHGEVCLHFKELDDLELTSVAKVIAMSTPQEYIAYYKRAKGLA